YNYYTGVFTLFSGKATDGLSTLTAMPSPWQCTKDVSNGGTCNLLQPGWYTIVTYGVGPSYSNHIFQNGYNGQVGYSDRIMIGVNTMCAGPKYNRPNLAAIDTATQQPFLIQWGPKV